MELQLLLLLVIFVIEGVNLLGHVHALVYISINLLLLAIDGHSIVVRSGCFTLMMRQVVATGRHIIA